jgi:hypothetical protein
MSPSQRPPPPEKVAIAVAQPLVVPVDVDGNTRRMAPMASADSARTGATACARRGCFAWWPARTEAPPRSSRPASRTTRGRPWAWTNS